MGERVTSELDAALLEQARDLARRQGLTLEAFLVQWIAENTAKQGSTLYVTNPEYPIFTPPGNEHVAQALMETVTAHKAAQRANGEVQDG